MAFREKNKKKNRESNYEQKFYMSFFLWNFCKRVIFLKNVKMALYWFHSWKKGDGLTREGVLYAGFYGRSQVLWHKFDPRALQERQLLSNWGRRLVKSTCQLLLSEGDNLCTCGSRGAPWSVRLFRLSFLMVLSFFGRPVLFWHFDARRNLAKIKWRPRT